MVRAVRSARGRAFAWLALYCSFAASGCVWARDAGTSEENQATIKATIGSIVRDQKTDFLTFPSEVAHGKHWVPVLAVSALTAGMIVADQHDTAYFRRTTAFHGYNSVMSRANTAVGIAALPVVLYSFGYWNNDTYAKRSALLAVEAAVDGEIAGEVVKLATQRRRPESNTPEANFGDSFGDANSVLDPSFPSDHAITAFAVATVVSERYGHQHRWVPLIAYGLATAVGLARVTDSAHYPSDVFFGAALGYVIGHFTVGSRDY